jgi:hypothetical protein
VDARPEEDFLADDEPEAAPDWVPPPAAELPLEPLEPPPLAGVELELLLPPAEGTDGVWTDGTEGVST